MVSVQIISPAAVSASGILLYCTCGVLRVIGSRPVCCLFYFFDVIEVINFCFSVNVHYVAWVNVLMYDRD